MLFWFILLMLGFSLYKKECFCCDGWNTLQYHFMKLQFYMRIGS